MLGASLLSNPIQRYPSVHLFQGTLVEGRPKGNQPFLIFSLIGGLDSGLVARGGFQFTLYKKQGFKPQTTNPNHQ